jgi:hypothetical protein
MSELAGAVLKKFPEPALQDCFRRLAVSRQPSLTFQFVAVSARRRDIPMQEPRCEEST